MGLDKKYNRLYRVAQNRALPNAVRIRAIQGILEQKKVDRYFENAPVDESRYSGSLTESEFSYTSMLSDETMKSFEEFISKGKR